MADRPQRERDMKLPVIEAGGRWFTKYNPQIALEIVERLAEGELLSRITSKDAQPLTITKATFLRWVATVPELQAAYSAALQISAHAFEEKAIEKAEAVADKPGTPQNVSAASLLISQYRWSASRRNPTKYSDKGNTQIVVPVHISTTLDMGSQKQTIDVEVPDIYTIKIPEASKVEDGEFTELSERSEQQSIDNDGRAESMEDAKEKFRELLRPDLPTVGTQRQPLIARTKKTGPAIGSKYKRVLVPRIKDGSSS